MEIELESNPLLFDEYVGDITRELDKLAGMPTCDDACHYVYIDKHYYKERHLLIRVPGCTVGSLYFNDDFIITKIVVNTDNILTKYPADVNEQMKKFVNTRLTTNDWRYFIKGVE